MKYTTGRDRTIADTPNWREKGFYFWASPVAAKSLQKLYDELFNVCEHKYDDPETSAHVTIHHIGIRDSEFDKAVTTLALKTVSYIEKYILKSTLRLPDEYHRNVDAFIRESIENNGRSLPYPPPWISLLGMQLPAPDIKK